MFLPTDFIGESRKTFKGRECLTWSEVRELHGEGVSFGSHTASHAKLHGLPWSVIRDELRNSRLKIEGEVGTSASCFAYPYAYPQEDREFVARFEKELMAQGYHAAVTTIVGRARSGNHTIRLPRLPINDSDDAELFSAKLAGAYDWMAGPQALVRRVKRGFRSARQVNPC